MLELYENLTVIRYFWTTMYTSDGFELFWGLMSKHTQILKSSLFLYLHISRSEFSFYSNFIFIGGRYHLQTAVDKTVYIKLQQELHWLELQSVTYISTSCSYVALVLVCVNLAIQ